MDDFIELTDWETAKPIHIRPSSILGVRRLAASVHESYGDDRAPHELGERTRIDTTKDFLLVRETAEEVMAMVRDETGEP